MTKTEFLTFLEQRLMVLNDSERADLLNEYEEHIDMKMESGLSEEEAIEGFGDPEELVKELLDAYHLNTDYQPPGSAAASRIGYYVKSCAHFVSSMFDTLFHYSMRDLFKLFLQACFLAAFLGVILIGGAFFGALLRSTIWQFWIGRVLYDVIAFFAWIIYMALAVYLVVFFIRRYILIDYQPLEPPVLNSSPKEPFRMENLHLDEHFDSAKNYAGSMAEQTSEAFARMKQKAAESRELRAAKREGREPVKIPFPDISLGELCMKIIVFCCRFIAFFFLLMAGCAALGLIAASATGLVFLVMGYKLFGPFLMILGCALFSVVATGILLQFVFGIGGDKHETV